MKKTSKAKPSLVILSEHYAPSTGATAQLISDLVHQLRSFGVSISVLTSTSTTINHEESVHRFLTNSGISKTIVGKILSGTYFLLGSLSWLLINTTSKHSLLIVSNPPFIGVLGLLLKRFKGIRYSFLLQDVFPRSAALTGVLPSCGPIYSIWRTILSLVVKESECTIVLSESMRNRVRHEICDKTELAVIHNWSVVDVNESHSVWDPGDATHMNPFHVQYSGNFGRLHEIITILESARLLQNQNIAITFIGDGAKREQIERYINTYQLSNVTLKPYQPREQLQSSLRSAHLSIVSLVPGAEDTVAPSKLYGILASGIPVLLIANNHCELSKLIVSNNCGIVVSPGDVDELAQAILLLKNHPKIHSQIALNARNTYTKCYGITKSGYKYYSVLARHKLI